MGDKENQKENTNYWPLILLSIGVVLLYCLSWLLIGHFISDSAEQGQFGDQFGAVNALFSGLAFAGLIFTIILQKKELSLQLIDYLLLQFHHVKECIFKTLNPQGFVLLHHLQFLPIEFLACIR